MTTFSLSLTFLILAFLSLAFSMDNAKPEECLNYSILTPEATPIESLGRRFISPTGYVIFTYESYFQVGHIGKVSNFKRIAIPGLEVLHFVDILRDNQRREGALTLILVGRADPSKSLYTFRLYDFSTGLFPSELLASEDFNGPLGDYQPSMHSAFIVADAVQAKVVISGAFKCRESVFPFVLRYMPSTKSLETSEFQDLSVDGFEIITTVATHFNHVIQNLVRVTDSGLIGASLKFDLDTLEASIIRFYLGTPFSIMISCPISHHIFEFAGTKVARISSPDGLYEAPSDPGNSIGFRQSGLLKFYHASSKTLFLQFGRQMATCTFKETNGNYIGVKVFNQMDSIFDESCHSFYFPKSEMLAFLPKGETWPTSIKTIRLNADFMARLHMLPGTLVDNCPQKYIPDKSIWNKALFVKVASWERLRVQYGLSSC